MTPIGPDVHGTDTPRSYANIVRFVRETPWAIRSETLAVIHELVALRQRGTRLTPEEVRERIGDGAAAAHVELVANLARLAEIPDDERDAFAAAAQERITAGARPSGYVAGTVAVLPLYGVLMPRAGVMTQYSGGTSVQEFVSALQAIAANEAVASILLDINSPGGSTDLIPEAAAAIRDAKASKPIEAIANTDACSAAYWLGSQADKFWVTPSGMAGSIGVVLEHDDFSAQLEAQGVKVTLIHAGLYKTEGNPYEPLSPEAEAYLQSIVDDFYELFTVDVAKGRGATAQAVKDAYGQGRVLTAQDAVDANLVDGIDTFDSVFARLARGGTTRRRARAESVLELEAAPPSLIDVDAFVVPIGGGSDKHPQATRDEHDPWLLSQALHETLTQGDTK